MRDPASGSRPKACRPARAARRQEPGELPIGVHLPTGQRGDGGERLVVEVSGKPHSWAPRDSSSARASAAMRASTRQPRGSQTRPPAAPPAGTPPGPASPRRGNLGEVSPEAPAGASRRVWMNASLYRNDYPSPTQRISRAYLSAAPRRSSYRARMSSSLQPWLSQITGMAATSGARAAGGLLVALQDLGGRLSVVEHQLHDRPPAECLPQPRQVRPAVAEGAVQPVEGRIVVQVAAQGRVRAAVVDPPAPPLAEDALFTAG